VPKDCAHQLVRLCDWSRPVKKASFSGAVSRSGFIHEVASDSASSHSISLNSPDPRGPVRFIGFLSRAGLRCCMIPAEPLAHKTPLFTGWSRLPSI